LSSEASNKYQSVAKNSVSPSLVNEFNDNTFASKNTKYMQNNSLTQNAHEDIFLSKQLSSSVRFLLFANFSKVPFVFQTSFTRLFLSLRLPII
jgi:hypothetical protein